MGLQDNKTSLYKISCSTSWMCYYFRFVTIVPIFGGILATNSVSWSYRCVLCSFSTQLWQTLLQFPRQYTIILLPHNYNTHFHSFPVNTQSFSNHTTITNTSTVSLLVHNHSLCLAFVWSGRRHGGATDWRPSPSAARCDDGRRETPKRWDATPYSGLGHPH